MRLPRTLAALALAVLAVSLDVVANRYLADGEWADAVLSVLLAATLSVPLIATILGPGTDDDHRPPGPPAFGT